MTFVIKTNSTDKSMQYLSFGLKNYYFSEKPNFHDSQKDVDKALAWAKKDIDKRIKSISKDVEYNEKRKNVKGYDTAVNRDIMKEAKKRLTELKSIKFKVVKL